MVAIVLLSVPGTAAPKSAITCAEVEDRLRQAATSLGDLLPVPEFTDLAGMPDSRKITNLVSIDADLRCPGGAFASYEAALTSGTVASIARWLLWSQASLISTDRRISSDRALLLVRRMQNEAVNEKNREEIRSGMQYGCVRLKSGLFEFEYSVQPGQVRVAYRPAEDMVESCKLLR